jgi:TRAP-type mannitol/chloroaromatic compound transport system substrate-binding protein
MKNRILWVVTLLLVVGLLGVRWGPQSLAPTPAAAQAKIKLKAQASFPLTSLLFSGNFKPFTEHVEKMSGGRLTIEALPPGAVVGAFEVADAVNRGVLDMAHTCTYYFIGKHKAAALFTDVPGGPFGMDVIDFWGWEYEGGGIELLNEFYQQVLKMKIHALPIFPTTAQSLGWFKKPINSLADMKGMRYRVPGIAAEVYKEMGVAVVTMAGGEVLPAGERGVLDATEWYTPGEDISIGLHQVWKFYHYPGMHETAGACDLLINKDVWDKLAPDLQAIVRGAAMQAAWRSLLQFNRQDAVALRDFKDKHKVTLVKTPDDVLKEYLRAWDKIAAAESAKDPFFKKVLESQKAYAGLVVPSRMFMNPYDIARAHYWTK